MSTAHDRAKAIFLAALELSPSERDAFVRQACADNETMRLDVASLLAFHDDGDEGGGDADDLPGSPPVDIPEFATGAVLDNRYRIVSRIGRGGMGDVWRADDLVLHTPVALKLLHATSPEARRRLLNEVRLARQITHPCVCRVFDVGEADGRVFFSMELVQGEDLSTLLQRVGRLPDERVIEIGRKICEGLAAAHAQGVLHRDLKPANILVDDQGRVLITDFGIAAIRTDATHHTLIGTPGYMAPEQVAQGTPLSERTDLYALGLVLYELVVGRHPLAATQNTAWPPRPSAVVPNVDRRLDRMIAESLATDPRQRPASAVAMAAGLAGDSAPRGRRHVRWLAGTAVAASVLIAALVTGVLWPRPQPSLNAHDTIVIADFSNTTGEPVFDRALKVALAVALEQSPFIKVFADERVRDTLRLMKKPPDGPVTRAIAREIAVREQLKALIAGSIASLGSHFVLTLEAINAQSGDVMARDQIEATSKEDVLAALGALTGRLRGKLGESLTSIERFDVPLPRATTTSLDALHAYALGLDEGRMNPSRQSIPYLKRAIELDPDFALAQAMLSGIYANQGQSALAPALSKRAFELRERVSERERFFISWRYYRDAEQSWNKGLDLARTWTATYPREALAFNSLGLALSTLGQYQLSVAPLREAMRLDPKLAPASQNLAATLIALERFDEAKQVLASARTVQGYFISQGRLSHLIALVEGDTASRARYLSEALSQPDSVRASNWEAHVFRFGGRIGAAQAAFQQGISLLLRSRLEEMAAGYHAESAEMHAFVGQCGEARREIAAGVALGRDNFTLERVSRALALCDAGEEVDQLTTELGQRFPQAVLTVGLAIPIAKAIVALQGGDAARALELLEPVRNYDQTVSAEYWPPFIRGQAYLRLKNGERASEEFRSIIDHRGLYPDALLYPLAYVGRARALALTGDVAAARQAYDAFFALWRDADAGLRPLVDARQEYDRLR